MSLEPLVKQYLSQQALLAEINAEKEVALAPLRKQIEKVVFAYSTASVDEKIAMLKQKILRSFVEKTLKLECATISRRVTRKLVVDKPHTLFSLLPIPMQAKVKLSFPAKDVMQLIDMGILAEPGVHKIVETESLVVKPN